ncbi:phage tail tube protein [uncultured Clostridium sp.]|uniref:phage tail tube protein n=1 Tax=uncultured Clostridium sp. TaxID=59620 RepID=UPI0026F3A5FE|nr:phage major tail protein, TP901-1 family [uncultured Clostridium sp.]
MGKKVAGVDVLLKIKKSGSYVVVGGQKGASLSRSAETIDVSDKTSGGWAESIMGLKSWGVDCEGFVTIGDEGYELLESAFENREAIDVELKVGGADGYTRTGKAVITDFPEEYQQDSAVSFSISLQGASPLTKTSNVGKAVSK